MKKAKENRAFSFITVVTFFAVLILVTSNFSVVCASSSSSNNVALPVFLENLLVNSHPNASKAELNQIRAIWINQIELKEERIASTNGAVLNYKPSDTRSGSYMSDYLDYEEFGGGVVYDGPNMEGLVDYNYARFYTPYDNAGASVIGELSSAATGDVYVVGKLGPTGYGQNGNYFTVFGNNVSDKNDEGWRDNFIGYGAVNHTYPVYNYIGLTQNTYVYVAVGVVTMGGECTYNDVLGDIVWFTNA
ncbi:MAG: hypothetical protein NWF00_08475 [Candidatus Bathyarchaeota archaeon]|nr:hypothetical protein [Candidatus Bathyarchaeota archaeon]